MGILTASCFWLKSIDTAFSQDILEQAGKIISRRTVAIWWIFERTLFLCAPTYDQATLYYWRYRVTRNTQLLRGLDG